MMAKLRLKGVERWYMLLCIIVFILLSSSILYQYLTTAGVYEVVGTSDDHKHSEHTLFDNIEKRVTITSDIKPHPTDTLCTHWSCLNSYKCMEDGVGKISIYVYDVHKYVDSKNKELLSLPSKEFVQLLWAIVNSKYAVKSPAAACILVPSIDLLNRESFSNDNAATVLASLPYWNNGTNHLIFNMVTAAAPNYVPALNFARGNAMVTGSGFTQRSYRRTFDISIPMFNPHQNDKDFKNNNNPNRQFFLVASQHVYFQSLYNQLVSLQSQRSDILVLLTTCSDMQRQTVKGDARCDRAVARAFSYPSVLTDAKFCIITREQQLANTYLHDILRAGCVPVISIDTYIMPFSEVLDWKRAAIFINEHRLDETLKILQEAYDDGNFYKQLQEQGRFFYDNYFSSMTKITWTTLDILNDRILPYRAKPYEHWNRPLVPSMPQSPFFVPLIPSQKQGFTAIVLTYDRFELMKRVVNNIAWSKHVAKIIIIWNNPELDPPPDNQWPVLSVPIKVIRSKYNRLSNRFFPYNEIETDCVLNIDDDITQVTPDELNFAYRVWTENADRLVGFPPRYHAYNSSELHYESEWVSSISMVLTGVAFYHKYYHYLFTSRLPGDMKQWVDQHINCEDIAMNFLITNTTGKAPIKVLARKKFKSTSASLSSATVSHLVARNTCMQKFTEAFGVMPLRTVEFRADPVLFKQPGYADHMKFYRSDGEL